MGKIKFIFLIITITLTSLVAEASEAEIRMDTIPRDYFFYPKSFEPWELGFHIGLGITRLPEQVVEEEISFSPMPNFDFRMGISQNWSVLLELNANYLSNYGTVGFQRTKSFGNVAYSIGANFSSWFGHLELESIKMKTWGMILSPHFTIGIDFGSMLFSTQFETQHHVIWNYADKEFLGTLRKLDGGFAVRFCAEQPLWNDHWVALSLKLNYAKFYYQSWISYSTVDEYFFYPEFVFGFIL
jgi:hypothetical protein